ncbi:MAG: hypothetical protein ACREGF_03190, partial [Candidatus Saccharimonadales bacterium]
MDNRSVELAQQSLQIYSETMAPSYVEARQELTRALGVSQLMIESMLEEAEQGRANAKMLQAFARILPQAVTDETGASLDYFSVDNPHEARRLINSAIWAEAGSRNLECRYCPNYIIGERPPPEPKKSNKKYVDLLLIAAEGHSPVTEASRLLRKEIELFKARNLYENFSEADIRRMLNRKTGQLDVGHGVSEALHMAYSVSGYKNAQSSTSHLHRFGSEI